MGSILGKSPSSERGGTRTSWHFPFFQSHLHVVMLGLDSSGKTTALLRLQFDQYVSTIPTLGFNTEKVQLKEGPLKGRTFKFWDIGGQDKLRPLWKTYSRKTDGIIFVIDSVDDERMEEAKMELHKILRQPDLTGTPLLVLANKQDLRNAKDPQEIVRILGLMDLAPSQPWHIEATCAVTGDGLEEGLLKLNEMIVQKRSQPSRSSLFRSKDSRRFTASI